MRASLSVAVLSLLMSSGCSLVTGSVKVEPVAVSSQKPGNVALFVAVSQHGSGVLGLQKQDFKVFENGTPLDNEQIGLTLLPPQVNAIRSRLQNLGETKDLETTQH